MCYRMDFNKKIALDIYQTCEKKAVKAFETCLKEQKTHFPINERGLNEYYCWSDFKITELFCLDELKNGAGFHSCPSLKDYTKLSTKA